MEVYKLILWLIPFLPLLLGEDLTLNESATGCEVTKSAVEKVILTSFRENILDNLNDNYLLYRVAYVSDFGENQTIAGSDRHGIWMLSEENLNSVKQSSFFQDNEILAETDNQVRIGNTASLNKPWHAAIVASILLRMHNESVGAVPARFDAEGQLNFWLSATGTNRTDAFERKFREGAQFLDSSDADLCLTCTDYQTDLVFALDDSGSISETEWDNQTEFVKQVLDSYEVSLAQKTTRAAVVIFSWNVSLSHGYSDEPISDVLDSYSQRGGYTNIGDALSSVTDIIKNDPLSRQDEQSVRKLVFFLTDGQHNTGDLEAGISDINTIKNFTDVFAIGMKSAANYSTLQRIASRPDFTRIYGTVDKFSADVSDIIYKACNTRTPVDVTDTAKLSLQAFQIGQKRHLVLEFRNGTDLFLTVNRTETNSKEGDGLLYVFYVSETQPYPSESDHDLKFTRYPNGTFDVPPLIPRDTKTGGKSRRSATDSGQTIYLTIETPSGQTCMDCIEDIDIGFTDDYEMPPEEFESPPQDEPEEETIIDMGSGLTIGLIVGVPSGALLAILTGVFLANVSKAQKRQRVAAARKLVSP